MPRSGDGGKEGFLALQTKPKKIKIAAKVSAESKRLKPNAKVFVHAEPTKQNKTKTTKTKTTTR